MLLCAIVGMLDKSIMLKKRRFVVCSRFIDLLGERPRGEKTLQTNNLNLF